MRTIKTILTIVLYGMLLMFAVGLLFGVLIGS